MMPDLIIGLTLFAVGVVLFVIGIACSADAVPAATGSDFLGIWSS